MANTKPQVFYVDAQGQKQICEKAFIDYNGDKTGQCCRSWSWPLQNQKDGTFTITAKNLQVWWLQGSEDSILVSANGIIIWYTPISARQRVHITAKASDHETRYGK